MKGNNNQTPSAAAAAPDALCFGGCLDRIVNAVADPVFLADRQHRWVLANDAACHFAGFRRPDILGKTVQDLFPHDEAAKFWTRTEEVFHTGRESVNEEKFTDRHGTVHVLVTRQLPLTDGAGRQFVVGVIRDITRNVLEVEQLRSQAALLDITQEAIFVRDLAGRIVYWNEGAAQLYGWSMAEARGRSVAELDLALDAAESARALHTVQRHGEWNGELRQKNRAGRELTVHSQWNLIRERDGKPKAVLAVNHDITEKKRLEAQLLRAQRLESIGTLASGLAHDLNNVLAPIMMCAQLLKDGARDEDQLASLQTLEACALRGANIIRQVLTFARGVEGQRVLLNPRHLIKEMERIARETFPKSIEIETFTPREPCLLLGDATQIQQVLMNLCVNARDAMPHGGRLAITMKKIQLDEAAALVHPKARPGDYVSIAVADTGTGIPPELMDRIFDPFFTTKPVGQGTGLGLPTVLGIVEGHGGFLQVDSPPGHGATFTACLPAVPTGDDQSAPAGAPAPVARGHGELVLVVDDEPAVRQLASTILNRHGYRTLTATEGREGLALFNREPGAIKLVVTDLMMPQLDGPGFIRELHRVQPGLKTITITGLGDDARVAEARSAGTDVVLNKPFTAEQLLANVKELLA